VRPDCPVQLPPPINVTDKGNCYGGNVIGIKRFGKPSRCSADRARDLIHVVVGLVVSRRNGI
jgi:hypothetical protein